MVEKEDLCLSLSLNIPSAVDRNRNRNSSSPQLSLLTSLVSSSPHFNLLRPASNWNDSDVEDVRVEGIDVNLMPGIAVAAAAAEVEVEVSSPNSSVSSIRNDDGRRTLTPDIDDNSRRKKLRLSKDQSGILEQSFKQQHTLNPMQKHALANRLGLRPRQVEVWFQNRRARRKLKQTEVEYELMKRCCENLTEENTTLQKELHELRALKHSPQKTPPTTICPSCEITINPLGWP